VISAVRITGNQPLATSKPTHSITSFAPNTRTPYSALMGGDKDDERLLEDHPLWGQLRNPDEPLTDIRKLAYRIFAEAKRTREDIQEFRKELTGTHKLLAEIRWWIIGGTVGVWALVAKLVMGL
jgi:hypothetical protein